MSADARTLADRLEAALPLIGAVGHHILLSLCHEAVALLRDLAAERDTLAAENERLRRGTNWEPVVSDRIPAEFAAQLSDKFLCRYDIEALDRSLADCGFRIIAQAALAEADTLARAIRRHREWITEYSSPSKVDELLYDAADAVDGST